MEKVEIGNCTLYCGDAFEIIPTLDDGAIDAVISDPPYASHSFGKCTDCDWDKPVPLAEFWQLLMTKTKPEANVCLFANMRLAHDLINTNRKGFRYDLVWVKNNKTGFLNAGMMPMRNHESILVFGRPGYQKASTYNPIKFTTGKPSVRRTKKQKGGVYPPQEAHTVVSDGSRHPCSVWAFNHERDGNKPDKSYHPVQKPTTLMGALVLQYSNEQDTILDCFMGAGTTAIAAIKLNRKFIGIERERKYFDTACKRLDEEMSKWKRAG